MRKRRRSEGGWRGARSLSLVFKNNDSLFSSSNELGSTLGLKAARRKEKKREVYKQSGGKEGTMNRSRMSVDYPV